MALIILGAGVGQASGRLGSDVFSRNASGSYIRRGTKPITSTTPRALETKAIFGGGSTSWKILTDEMRQAWTDWAATVPWLNRLGQSILLTGQQGFVRSFALAAQNAALRVPTGNAASLTFDATAPTTNDIPVNPIDWEFAPDIADVSWSFDYGGTFGPDSGIWAWEAVKVISSSRNYIANTARLFWMGAAAGTGENLKPALEAFLGPLVEGDVFDLQWYRISPTNYLSSPKLRSRFTVVDTTP